MSEIQGGLIVDVVEEDIPRVSKILAGIPNGVYKAVGSALARAGKSGITHGARMVSKEYTLPYSEIVRHVRTINRRKDHGSGIEVVFGYAGHVIPLVAFDFSAPKTGKLAARVKKSSSKETLDRAFVGHMGRHVGIFQRETEERFPVKELFGPAVPSMMYSNEEVMDSIEEKVVETYEKRIEHEITRILNGYGGKA